MADRIVKQITDKLYGSDEPTVAERLAKVRDELKSIQETLPTWSAPWYATGRAAMTLEEAIQLAEQEEA